MKRLFILTIILFALAGVTFWYIGQDKTHIAVGGVSLKTSEGVKTLSPAAKAGDQKAQYELARLYEMGEGVTKDLVKAFQWYKKSAEQGYPESRYKMGWMYSNGSGVRQDLYLSAKWYRIAAAFNDHTESQFRLGELYFNGRGVEHDYGKAITYYQQAANKGHAASQYLLGSMYVEGWGVAQDYVQAYIWLKLAVPNRAESIAIHKKYDPVSKLKSLKIRMNNFQINQAEKRLVEMKTSF